MEPPPTTPVSQKWGTGTVGPDVEGPDGRRRHFDAHDPGGSNDDGGGDGVPRGLSGRRRRTGDDRESRARSYHDADGPRRRAGPGRATVRAVRFVRQPARLPEGGGDGRRHRLRPRPAGGRLRQRGRHATTATTVAAAAAVRDEAAPSTAGGGSSTTNTQEADVDEGDLVENDGHYLYSVVDGRLRDRRGAGHAG